LWRLLRRRNRTPCAQRRTLCRFPSSLHLLQLQHPLLLVGVEREGVALRPHLQQQEPQFPVALVAQVAGAELQQQPRRQAGEAVAAVVVGGGQPRQKRENGA
jgi:hypothetical protein